MGHRKARRATSRKRVRRKSTEQTHSDRQFEAYVMTRLHAVDSDRIKNLHDVGMRTYKSRLISKASAVPKVYPTSRGGVAVARGPHKPNTPVRIRPALQNGAVFGRNGGVDNLQTPR